MNNMITNILTYEFKEDLAVALLRAKREARGNDELTKELNRLQRTIESTIGVQAVDIAEEYNEQYRTI